jgi:8-oxo-dGTP diphosphatase
MIHRNKNPNDHHYGKFNGLGGKQREIREEAGIECTRLELRATISWPGFGKRGEDWFGFLFRIEEFHGEPHSGNHEGELVWIDIDRVMELNLWEGDRLFLSAVLDSKGRPLHGVMPYKDGKPVSWSFQEIE